VVGLSDEIFLTAFGLIRIRSEVMEKLHELARLADEKSVRSESLDYSHRSPLGLGWTNNRTDRETSVKERARLRHDQVGRYQLIDRIVSRWNSKIYKGYRRVVVDGVHDRQRGIACVRMPALSCQT